MPKGNVSLVHNGPVDMGAFPNFPVSGASLSLPRSSMSSAPQRRSVNQGASSSIHHGARASLSDNRTTNMNAMPKGPVSSDKDTVKNRTMMRSQSTLVKTSKNPNC